MKILRIKDAKGEFSTDGSEYRPIDVISKENILRMIELITTEECEMDDLVDDKSLPNKAHFIIYNNLLSRFKELKDNRSYFQDIRDKTYQDAINKYKIKP